MEPIPSPFSAPFLTHLQDLITLHHSIYPRIPPQGVSTRTIDMHVTRLREKLRDDPAEPRILLTVRGKGYMFQSPIPNS